VAYHCDGQTLSVPPLDTEQLSRCEPVYEALPGWQCDTQGIQQWADLPANAQAYLNRIQTLVGVPLAIVSTGASREDTIVLKKLF
jgi:adenylosuccinate synthase